MSTSLYFDEKVVSVEGDGKQELNKPTNQQTNKPNNQQIIQQTSKPTIPQSI